MNYALIQIISLSGERIARFRADPSLTVQAIYRDLQRRLGLQIYRQALLYQNEVLDSAVYLSELGDGGEIELTLIVRNVSLVVTSSSDYTAKVWNWLNGDCVWVAVKALNSNYCNWDGYIYIYIHICNINHETNMNMAV